jgi:hypothetical protein
MLAQRDPRTFTFTAHPYRDTLVIDSRAPRFNQTVVALGSLVALVTGFWPLTALLGLQLAAGLLFGRQYCLPCLFYFEVLQPRFGEGPLEDARAPRFANQIGALVLISASALGFCHWSLAAQTLTASVTCLASLSALTGLCAGCELYKWAAKRRGIAGGALETIDLAELQVGAADNLAVLFTHPLCSQCQRVEPALIAAGKRVIKIDVGQRKDLAKKYGVTLVPMAYALASDGRVLSKLS